jgi:reverse gyrase
MECKCGRYSVQVPCYDCLKEENEKLKAQLALTNTDLLKENRRLQNLVDIAEKTCPKCTELCAVKRTRPRDE